MYQKMLRKKHADLLLIGEKDKNAMFLSKILVHLCTMIDCTVEENKRMVKTSYQTLL